MMFFDDKKSKFFLGDERGPVRINVPIFLGWFQTKKNRKGLKMMGFM